MLYFLYGIFVYVLWVLVVMVCICECFGVDGFVMVGDDGIVVCLLEMDVEFFGVELFVFELYEFD